MAQQAKGFKINGVVYDLDLSSVGTQTAVNFKDKTGRTYGLTVGEDGQVQVVNTDFEYSTMGSPIGTTTAEKNSKYPSRSGAAIDLGGSYITNFLRINSCYFGGSGNPLQAGCAATHNFVELANSTNFNISLNGLYLFYAGTGTQIGWNVLPLEGIIPAHGTYLVRGAKCSEPSNVTVDVVEPDMTWYSYSVSSGSYDYGKPLEFDSLGGSFYLALSSGSKVYDAGNSTFVDPYELSVTNPYRGDGPIPGYIDLCGCQANGAVLNISEGNSACVSSQTSIRDTIFFRQNGLEPGSSQLKAWSARKSGTLWSYCRMNQPDSSSAFPYFDAELKAKLAPGSSKHPKSFGSWRKTFKADKPNCINVSFGKQATETAAGNDADRCFNWISKGYYDEYVEYRLQGSDTWLRKYSISSIGDHKFDVEYVGDNVVSTYIKVYDRIRWITPTGDNVTTHKTILRGLSAGTYEYRIGRLGDENYHSDIRIFKVRSDSEVNSNGFSFVHISDQQGFTYNEYLAWEKSAYAIKQEHPVFDFIVNTGDISQSGNRECEWIDYYEGKAILGDVEEMTVVGNNDLCGRYYSLLTDGTTSVGVEHTKINSYSVWLFYCADLDADNPVYMEYKPSGTYSAANLGVNVLEVSSDYVIKYFIPLVYSFDYGTYHFTFLNSEFKVNCTEYLVYNNGGDGSEFEHNVYYNQYKWLERDYETRGAGKNNIVLMHEIPFCIVSGDKDASYNATERTVNIGSMLNRDFYTSISTAPTNYAADLSAGIDVVNTYYGGECFSSFFQDHDYRLCMGGHKHTYSLSYPIFENVAKNVQFVSSDYGGAPIATFNSRSIYLKTDEGTYYYDLDYTEEATRRVIRYNNPIISGSTGCYTRESYDPGSGQFVTASVETPSGSAVVYAMTQATGYKLTSNKDIPGRNISWLYQYYPCNTSGVVNTGQQYPMYQFTSITGSNVKVHPYIVTGVVDHSSGIKLFDLNNQMTAGPEAQRMVDINISSSISPVECIINY